MDARLKLGIVLYELGRLRDATDVLGQLVVEHPGLAAGWAHLARAIVPQGYAWEAHDAISRASSAKPDAEALLALSSLHLGLQDVEAAESASRQAVEMTPDSASAWIQLGQILALKGQRSDAIKAYQRAMATEPGNAVVAFFLAAMGADDPANRGGAPTMAPPEYVRALFDNCADRFDGMLVGSLSYRTPKLLDRMFSNWLKRNRAERAKKLVMLDAGCGTGLCGLWMNKYRGQLIGVDLSRRMISEAQDRKAYDELVPGEVVEELEKRPEALDLIVAADVLVYFGDLNRLFTAGAAALRPGGIFLLSVEAITEGDYRLLPTQRFAHSMNYLSRLAAANGLAVRATEAAVLRLEQGTDVKGFLLLAEKTAGMSS